MEKKKSTRFKASLKYAVIISLLLIIISLVFYTLDMSASQIPQFVSIAIFIAALSWALISYRNNDVEGSLSYGGVVGTGVMMSLFIALILAIYSFIYFSYIDTNYVDIKLEEAEEKLIEKGLTDEQIDQGMKYTSMFISPTVFAIGSIFFNFLIGLVISLIAAAFIRNDKA